MTRALTSEPRYPFPYGVVPRLSHPGPIEMIEPPHVHDEAIQKALDAYELMVRKAGAWDELRAHWVRAGAQHHVDRMDATLNGRVAPT